MRSEREFREKEFSIEMKGRRVNRRKGCQGLKGENRMEHNGIDGRRDERKNGW